MFLEHQSFQHKIFVFCISQNVYMLFTFYDLDCPDLLN